MKQRFLPVLFISLIFISYACRTGEKKQSSARENAQGSFGYDLSFLRKYHNDLLVLSEDSTGPAIIVAPAYQGRIMTSTAEGLDGASFGWINHELISSGKPELHMNAFGGEERIWIGPEGGQFSFYFKQGVPFIFDNWFVPKEIDTEPFHLVSSTKTAALFEKQMHLVNYSGISFDIKLERAVQLLSQQTIDSMLNLHLPDSIKTVGFETDNRITNTGQLPWTKKTGMPSIWILSMLNASNSTVVVVPYKQGDSSSLGKIMTDDYFGKVPSNRLKADSGLIIFSADGKYRSKIGISPKRALPIAGSYDKENGVFTIATFSLPTNANEYVNSLWKIQADPFSGDAVNAYNDGPVNGKQMGNFYEIESSSPAAALQPGMSLSHRHATIHIKAGKEMLNTIAMKLFGVGLDQIKH